LGEEIIGSDPCNSTIIRTWVAVDECGNQSTASQTITVSVLDVAPTNCLGDFVPDGIIDFADMEVFNSAYGQPCDNCQEDLDNNGVVDEADFWILQGLLGSYCNDSGPNITVDDFVNSGDKISPVKPDLDEDLEGLKNATEVFVAPNPNDGQQFQLIFNNSSWDGEEATVVLINARGQRVGSMQMIVRGDRIQVIQQQPLLNGLYFIHLITDSEVKTAKMIVK